MLVTSPSIVALDKFAQLLNVLSSIIVTLLGIDILVSPVLSNAELPIVVKLVGNVIVVNAVHPLNAEFPMLVTLPLNVTLDKLIQLLNVLSLIVVT